MLTEALQQLATQAVKAASPKVLTPEAEPKHHYAIVDPATGIKWFDAAPKPRGHASLSLEPIVVFATREDAVKPEIWYSRSGVTVFTKGEERRDQVALELKFSPQLETLAAWYRSRTPLSQQVLVSTLRTTFARCLGRAGDFLNIIRKVTFVNNAAGTGTIQHGKASIGRQIEQEVGGAAPIPENITFEVPVWDAHFRRIEPIDCAIEIDAANATFSIIPLPQSIEDAIANAEAALGDALVGLLQRDDGGGAKVPIYYGRP